MAPTNSQKQEKSDRQQWAPRTRAIVRLLVMGAKRVGKSAAIVRFTTGRFIQSYCPSTQDWLYKHPIELPGSTTNVSTVELLELEDLDQEQFESNQTIHNTNPERTKKLLWAHAFIIIYSITSSETFNKAKLYLNLALQATQQHQQTNKRPAILLLANKNDLGDRAREVTQEEGRELARHHQCLFAEISIAQSADSIYSTIIELMGSIDKFHYELSISLDRSDMISRQTQLVRWAPETERENIPVQQSTPIWCSLVKTKLAIANSTSHSIAGPQMATISLTPKVLSSCRPLLRAAPIKATVSSISSSELAQVQVLSSSKPMIASKPSQPAPDLKQKHQETHSTIKQRHGGSLRSSFKRASLAIVGGKTLALNSSLATAHRLNKSSNWFKSKFTSSTRQETQSMGSDTKLNSCSDQVKADKQKVENAGFRRPMFKYKNRVKTVAFDEIGLNSVEKQEKYQQTIQPSDSIQTMAAVACLQTTTDDDETLSLNNSHHQEHKQPNGAPSHNKSFNSGSSSCYNLNRCSSGRSSSSLSTTNDTNYSSFFIVCNEQNDYLLQHQPVSGQRACSTSSGLESRSSSIFSGDQVQQAPRVAQQQKLINMTSQRKDSRSTLSRASTSGGSYGDDEDEDDVTTALGGEESTDEDHTRTGSRGQVCNSGVRCWMPLVSTTTNGHTINNNPNKPPLGRGQEQHGIRARHQQLIEMVHHNSLISETQPCPKVGKIAFCKALVKSIGSRQTNNHKATGLETIQHFRHHNEIGATIQRASIEQIQTVPVSGFCK